MNAKPDIRWGLIGYGDLAGKRVAAALATAANSILEGVWGRDSSRTREFAQKHGIRAHESLESLVNGNVDAIYVCTPPDAHAGYALRAMEAGKHVLVEKPMAATVPDCERMVAAAVRAQRTLGVAYYRRAFAKAQKIRELIRSGALGIPTWANSATHSWFNPAADDPKHWRVETARSGGAGALADIGVHRLDLLGYWLGPLRLAFCNLHRLIHTYEVDDGASAVLTLTNGAPVHVYCAWNSKVFMDRLELVGSEGKLMADPLDGPDLTVLRGRDRKNFSLPLPSNVHQPCIEDFVCAVREKRAPLCDGSEGLKTSRLLAQMVEGISP